MELSLLKTNSSSAVKLGMKDRDAEN